MACGGDMIEARWNHPTLGSGVFWFKSAEDSTFDLGGFVSTDDANMIDGSGTMIDQKNRKRWKFGGTISWDMNSSNELATIQNLVESCIHADWVFTSVNGTAWKGNGIPVGDYEGNGNSTTFPITIAGGGKLTKI